MTRNNNTPYSRNDYDSATASRIEREVIILEDDKEAQDEELHDEDREEESEEESDEELYDDGYDEAEEEEIRRKREKPWMIITTGSILTDGTLPYYRYFIAIAVMCFVSIFLTFMSLNADREFRKREKYASTLHERAVLKEEERYSLSTKSAVVKRLKENGIELTDLSKESRLIEK